MNKTAIVVGSGIVGIATTYHLLKQGYQVIVLEKNLQPIGASIRNFGMIWPIGQPPGYKYQLALKSRELWTQLSKDAGFHLHENGSLHLAYHPDEKMFYLNLLKQIKLKEILNGFPLKKPNRIQWP